MSADGTQQQTQVIDLVSGATLATRPPLDLGSTRGTREVLSPDGTVLTFAETENVGTIVRQQQIDGGVTTERLRTTNSFQLGATSEAGVAVAFVEGGLVTVDTGSGRKTFGDVCPTVPDGKIALGGPLELSTDGGTLRYDRGYWSGHRPGAGPYGVDEMAANVATGAAVCLDMRHPRVQDAHQSFGFDSTLAGGGAYLGTTGVSFSPSGTGSYHATLVDTISAEGIPLLPAIPKSILLDVSDDGGRVLMTVHEPFGAPGSLVVLDRHAGVMTKVAEPGIDVAFALLSGDGSRVVFTLHHHSPSNEAPAIYVAELDVDLDGMHDAWETAYGLNPSSAADASLDPDGDGRTNAQEYADGTHPSGQPVRYFAEGADGAFFATSLALFNPSTTAATVNVRFLGPAGATASRPVALAAQAPAYLDAGSLGLPFTEFSIVVESAAPVVAERRMTWDRSEGYGLHTGNGVATPATQWHFAEGATIAGIQTFLLLQNPGAAPAAVTTRYLLANGATQERQYTVPASSRLTVWVNQEGAPLDAAEFATTVIADVPIVAERATYRDAASKTFGAGSVAAGVATPSTTWMF
ncbi:MAG TPA: hypothetical protein VMF13_09030, partial [Luteitalea sp.]|nr:hypothetical protein [Luteitalea sp.]